MFTAKNIASVCMDAVRAAIPDESHFKTFPALWNCGCAKWMHGTGEDACDLFLPERIPAKSECPVIATWRDWQAFNDNTRCLNAARALGVGGYALYAGMMAESGDVCGPGRVVDETGMGMLQINVGRLGDETPLADVIARFEGQLERPRTATGRMLLQAAAAAGAAMTRRR